MSYNENRQEYIQQILSELIELLPSSYNKETTDTNYYKLLRALAHELGDAKVEIEAVKNNAYLETVNPDAIYNNFGTLVKLQKMPEWDDEKYRSLISSVIQSLLIGPTKDSLVQAFKMFTDFKVQVHELFKDADKVDPSIYSGYNPKFTFVLEIEKPLDVYAENATLQRDANYIIGILKPAHTIGIQIVNLTGEEDFRYYYGVDKKVNDLTNVFVDEKIGSKISDLVTQNLSQQINSYASSKNVSTDLAADTIYISNYNMTRIDYQQFLDSKAKILYDKYLEKFDTKNGLNDNPDLIPTLTLGHFRKTVSYELLKEYDKINNAKLISNAEIGTSNIIEADITINSGEHKKASIVINANKDATKGYLVEVNLTTQLIKIIDIKTKAEIATYTISSELKLKEKFTLKVQQTNSTVNVFLNNTQVITATITKLTDSHFGFSIGRDSIEISNVKLNTTDISVYEKSYQNKYWSSCYDIKSDLLTSGCYYEKNGIKSFSVPGLIDKTFLDAYKHALYLKSNSTLTKTKLTKKITAEKERLKEIYAKTGYITSTISETEWDNRAIASIKNTLLEEHVVELLGGQEVLYSNGLLEASKFKDDFEQAYNNLTPYLGMDSVDVESNESINEGHFGWKHLTYKGQLTTTIDPNGSKIGGTDLIGPRYTLYDDAEVEVDSANKEFVGFSTQLIKLAPYKINSKGEYTLNEEGLGLNQSRILGFKENGDPIVANRLTGTKTDDLTDYHIFTQDYEEDAVMNKMDPNGTLTVDIFDVPIEKELEFLHEDREVFKFTFYRNQFVLTEDMLNVKEFHYDNEPPERYWIDLDFKEDIAIVKNNDKFLDIYEEELSFVENRYVIDRNSDISTGHFEFNNEEEHFFMTPIRTTFIIDRDKLNNHTIGPIYPDNMEEIESQSSENLNLQENVDEERSVDATINEIEDEFREVEEVKHLHQESFLEETFLFSKLQNAFFLTSSSLNHTLFFIGDEVDAVSHIEVDSLEETINDALEDLNPDVEYVENDAFNAIDTQLPTTHEASHNEKYFMDPIKRVFSLNLNQLNSASTISFDNKESLDPYTKEAEFILKEDLQFKNETATDGTKKFTHEMETNAGEEIYTTTSRVEDVYAEETEIEEKFEFTKYRSFVFDNSFLNDSQVGLTDEEANGPDLLETPDYEHSETINKTQEVLVENAIEQNLSEEFRDVVEDEEIILDSNDDKFYFTPTNLFMINGTFTNDSTHGLGFGNEHHGDTVQGVMSRIDENGNEIIIETRVI